MSYTKDDKETTPPPGTPRVFPLGHPDWKPKRKLLCMADVEFRRMQWLWHPYIPMGSASMLFGPGGLGKSHIACDIAARVSTGRPLPGQQEGLHPQKVLLMTAEDDPEAVLEPRLKAAGAAMENIFVPDESFILDLTGIATMTYFMKQAAATVVFIDPVVSFVGGKIDMNKMNEVRTFTGALHLAAQKTGSAVIIVHHSRKGKAGEDYEKAAGSADFNNAVRSVLFVSRDAAGMTTMSHVKSNYSALGDAVPYSLNKDDQLIWGDPIHDFHGPGGQKTREIQDWLKVFLTDGPQPALAVLAAAKLVGYSLGTINRAKPAICESFLVVNPDNNRDKAWWWRLI